MSLGKTRYSFVGESPSSYGIVIQTDNFDFDFEYLASDIIRNLKRSMEEDMVLLDDRYLFLYDHDSKIMSVRDSRIKIWFHFDSDLLKSMISDYQSYTGERGDF